MLSKLYRVLVSLIETKIPDPNTMTDNEADEANKAAALWLHQQGLLRISPAARRKNEEALCTARCRVQHRLADAERGMTALEAMECRLARELAALGLRD